MYEYYPTSTMTYLTYTQRRGWTRKFFEHAKEILVAEYNLDPDQALNIASRSSLLNGTTHVNNYGAVIKGSCSTGNINKNKQRIFELRSALCTVFNHIPENMMDRIKHRQQTILNSPAMKLLPKTASYGTGHYHFQLIERGSHVPTTHYLNTVTQSAEDSDHAQCYLDSVSQDTDFTVDDLQPLLYHHVHQTALTLLALHLTKLQLINQCMPNP